MSAKLVTNRIQCSKRLGHSLLLAILAAMAFASCSDSSGAEDATANAESGNSSDGSVVEEQDTVGDTLEEEGGTDSDEGESPESDDGEGGEPDQDAGSSDGVGTNVVLSAGDVFISRFAVGPFFAVVDMTITGADSLTAPLAAPPSQFSLIFGDQTAVTAEPIEATSLCPQGTSVLAGGTAQCGLRFTLSGPAPPVALGFLDATNGEFIQTDLPYDDIWLEATSELLIDTADGFSSFCKEVVALAGLDALERPAVCDGFSVGYELIPCDITTGSKPFPELPVAMFKDRGGCQLYGLDACTVSEAAHCAIQFAASPCDLGINCSDCLLVKEYEAESSACFFPDY